MIVVGMKVRFDPFVTSYGYGISEMRSEVVGTVVEVYYNRQWFSVQYGNNLRTSFKFCDIGDRVRICK